MGTHRINKPKQDNRKWNWYLTVECMFVGGLLFMSHGGHAPWSFGCPFVVLEQTWTVNCSLKEKSGPGPWVHLSLCLYRDRSMQIGVHLHLIRNTEFRHTLGPLPHNLSLTSLLLDWRKEHLWKDILSFLSAILNLIPGSRQIIKELHVWTVSFCSLRELRSWGLHFAVRP